MNLTNEHREGFITKVMRGIPQPAKKAREAGLAVCGSGK